MADLTIDELLTTTRAVRKRLDLTRDVDESLVRECLEIALQAPTGSNAQDWHFVVVRDAGRRAALAELYRDAYRAYRASRDVGEGERATTLARVASSADHLAEHLHEVPVHLVPCIRRRLPPDAPNAQAASLYGSIVPAVWNFMLAARARGLGTSWTTLHLVHEGEAAKILDLPYDEVTQAALIPVAHHTGDRFRAAPRRPVSKVVSIDRYGNRPDWD